jgi:hypothetical protein
MKDYETAFDAFETALNNFTKLMNMSWSFHLVIEHAVTLYITSKETGGSLSTNVRVGEHQPQVFGR